MHDLLEQCFGDGMIAEYILENSRKLGEKFTFYSLERKQMIPKLKLKIILSLGNGFLKVI